MLAQKSLGPARSPPHSRRRIVKFARPVALTLAMDHGLGPLLVNVGSSAWFSPPARSGIGPLSQADYTTLLELAQRFRSLPTSGPRACRALQWQSLPKPLLLTEYPDPQQFRAWLPAAFGADVRAFSPRLQFLSRREACSIRPAPTWRWELIVLWCATACAGVPKTGAPTECAAVSGLAGAQGGMLAQAHPSQGLLDLVSPGAVQFRLRAPPPRPLGRAAGSRHR